MSKRISIKIAILGLVAGCLFVCAGAANAQTATMPVQDPWAIKLGVLWPSNGSATYNGGSTQFSAGADYAFEKTTGNNPVLPEAYFDYNGGSNNGGHVDSYGLGVAVRAYGNRPAGATRQGMSPFVGAGIGLYYTDIANNGFFYRSGTNWSVGGKVFAGLDFSRSIFAEVNYQFISSEEGVNPSGLGLQVGFRF